MALHPQLTTDGRETAAQAPQERHEQAALFTPAPAVMPGQTTLPERAPATIYSSWMRPWER